MHCCVIRVLVEIPVLLLHDEHFTGAVCGILVHGLAHQRCIFSLVRRDRLSIYEILLGPGISDTLYIADSFNRTPGHVVNVKAIFEDFLHVKIKARHADPYGQITDAVSI